MNNNIDYELLAKFFSGECTEEEKTNVKGWIAEKSDNQKVFDSVKKLWIAANEKSDPSDINILWGELAQKAEISLQEENQLIYKPEPDRKNWLIKFWNSGNKILRYAAAIILIGLISYSVYLIIKPGEIKHEVNYKLLSVETGKQSSIILSDGTKITLDSGRELYYPEKFSESTRKVKLNGEGYFNVTHNKEKPFEVEINNALITVLGTMFNIRSWNENDNVQVKVIQGKVSLSQEDNSSNRVVIKKGYGSELHSDGTISTPHSIDIEKTLLWLKGEMYLDNVSVRETVAQIERWYGVKIILSNKAVANERITVHINKKSLKKNLYLLTQLIDSRFKISGSEIYIQPSGK
jgi:transmembrane sensor